jgi:hypothetical protein
VDFYNAGSDVWVNVTVNHGPLSTLTSLHYVNDVQVEINGTVQHLPRVSQTTETFFVQYNIGPSNNTYSIRAAAVCTLHGISAFSNLVTVPEFISVVLLAVAAVLAVVVRRKTLAGRKQ